MDTPSWERPADGSNVPAGRQHCHDYVSFRDLIGGVQGETSADLDCKSSGSCLRRIVDCKAEARGMKSGGHWPPHVADSNEKNALGFFR